jgi:4-hydroxybenzoate polyprenyltransferase
MKQLIPYAQLVRLPNTFTAMADIFLGALAGGCLLGSWLPFLCLLGASTFLYWSGMVWNDYFDLDQDRKERPGRPLASGRVSLRAAWFLACGLMLGGLLLAFVAGVRIDQGAWVFGWRPLVIAALLVASIFLYNGVLKTTWAGPILMGLCRFLNILLGLSILGVAPPFWGWLLALIIGTYIAGVTWFARTEARESSQSMLIGAAMVILVSLVLALAVPAVVQESPIDRFTYLPQPSLLFPYLLAFFWAFLGLAVLRAIKRPEPTRVQPAVRRAILGLVVLDALLASAFVGTFGLLLAILLIPGMILGRWLYST